ALGAVDQVRSPFDFAATPASVRTPPPLLGEHADEILGELGYGPAQIAVLRAGAVI
ncbi:MAG: CoA transferase, partial [Chloroflexi bacterium]|nr:CoA transferase [Chloroflexota bacterium]